MSSIMDDVLAQVEQMDESALRERVAKYEKDRAARKEAMKTRNANLSPEEKTARNEKAKAYRAQHGDKFKAQRDAYNARPEVKAKRAAYMKKRNEFNKALLRRAKELGVIA